MTTALSPSQLLTLGLFVFGMDTMAYSELERIMNWRFSVSERLGARPAAQFTGPGLDQIRLDGFLVPEIAGAYSAIDRLTEMADTGDNWPLINGAGRVFGHFRIVELDQRHHNVMAGGIPRAVEFSVNLERAD